MTAKARQVAHSLEITHQDKNFFPEDRVTKGDIADYYQTIADVMMPYVKDHPVNLLRHPNGIKGESFFQKDMTETAPAWAKTVTVYSESNQKNIEYLVCKDTQTLLYQVQLGCIEINPWLSKSSSIDRPEWLVLDLDPEKIGFEQVIRAAQAIRKLLDKLELISYPKTSGKTGLHVYLPLGAKYSFKQSTDFAHALVDIINQQLLSITSTARSPSKRQGKIYLDYLQNRKGQTVAAPYSLRPVDGAAVAAPLEWSEVKRGLDPQKFNIKTIFKRLDKKGDLMKPMLRRSIDLRGALKAIEGYST